MTLQVLPPAGRSIEQIREHYEIETALAERLRHSTRDQRTRLYAEVYDELFSRVHHHPLVAAKRDTAGRERMVSDAVRFLKRFLRPQSTFLEIGPGDCALAFAAAKFCKKVYAVDVSEEIMCRSDKPANCELLLSDGCSVPVPTESVDVAYSKDVIEHLHPDDALEQNRQIWEALAPGGIYICRTPNALSGPHDVSKFFDEVATGLHLKEYTTTELARLFRAVGYSRVRPYVWAKGVLVRLPLWPVVAAESVLRHFPRPVSRSVASHLPLKRALSRTIAIK